MKDLISIIIPVYNVEKYLRKCLDSVINQSYNNLEIIIINDNSTDNSLNILLEYKKLDSRIKVINLEKNKGVSYSRNIGIDNSNGEYITFIDSDDYVEIDYIETLYNLIKENNYDISIVGFTKIINDKKYCLSNNKKYKLNQENLIRMLLDSNNDLEMTVWGKLYKKEIFFNIRFKEGKIFEDIDVISKIFFNINSANYLSISKYNYIVKYGSLAYNKYSDKEKDRINFSYEFINKVIDKYPNLEFKSILFYINNLIAVSNKQIFDKIYNSDIINKTKKVIKNNYFKILFSNISFIKKIQYSLFIFNIKLYEKIYIKIKKDNVLVRKV